MQLFDLNAIYLNSSYNPPQYYLRRSQDEFWKNGLRSIASAPAAIRIQSLCSSISRQSQSQKLLLPRSIPLHGLRSTDLSRKPARHRNVPQLPQGETLSHGIPREARQVNSSRCKRTPGLPHISGLRLCAYQHSQQTLSGRRTGFRSEVGGLCFGFNRHRSLPVHLPMGNVSQDESRYQSTHTPQCAGINSDLYFRGSRKHPRCQDNGYRSLRSRFGLYDGPSVSRFRTALSDQSSFCILCHQEQKQHTASSHLFRSGGQNTRSSSRSNGHARRLQITVGVSRSLSPGTLFTMPNETSVSWFLRTTSLSRPRPSQIFIAHVGRWSCSSSGSNNTCGSSRFSEHLPMRSRRRYGLPSVFIFSWRLSRSD